MEGIARYRINTYREPGDPGYEEHHVEVPVVPKEGYPGKMIPNPDAPKSGESLVASFIPENAKDYGEWLASLPTVWQNNPCLNQFIQVNINTTQAQLEEIMREHIKRLKSSYPLVISPAIQGPLKAQIETLGISKWRIKPISLLSKNAVVSTHPILALEVKG
jgi:hypothetical protein